MTRGVRVDVSGSRVPSDETVYMNSVVVVSVVTGSVVGGSVGRVTSAVVDVTGAGSVDVQS